VGARLVACQSADRLCAHGGAGPGGRLCTRSDVRGADLGAPDAAARPAREGGGRMRSALAIAAIALLLIPQFSVGSGTEFTSNILIFAIMAVGLYVQIGLLGLVNFGFSAFFGLGGYLWALLLMRWSPSLL